jgi:hypothetical protein
MKKFLVISLFLASFTLRISAQIPSFTSPVEGTYLKDYFITSYVDWKLVGYQDYNCGTKSYNAHQGTDFLLKSFARMDSGVYVIAAAAGTIVEIADTFFDRNMALTTIGAGNYVAIKHSNNYYTYYTHMKKKSLLVKVGDVVTQGQRLGQIGSSGYSSDPQLHFEVWNDTIEYVDPFSGNCGNSTSMWTNQFAYDSIYRIMDKGLIPIAPTLNILRERYASKQIYTKLDSVICFWVQESGVKLGDTFAFVWYDPQGNPTDTFTSTYYYNSWYYYNWSYIYFPKTGPSGVWHVKYSQNGVLKQDVPFTVDITNSIATNRVNPSVFQSGNQINISYPSAYQIRLYDIRGKLMFDKANNKGLVVTDVSGWPAGAYILQFTSKEGFYTQKFILR